MIERLVRGLYYYLYGKPLGLSTKIEIGVLADVGIARVSQIFSEQERHFVGPDFEYWATRIEEDVTASAWFFRFYGVHCSFAVTGSFADTAVDAGRGSGPGIQMLVKDGEVIAINSDHPLAKRGP